MNTQSNVTTPHPQPTHIHAQKRTQKHKVADEARPLSRKGSRANEAFLPNEVIRGAPEVNASAAHLRKTKAAFRQCWKAVAGVAESSTALQAVQNQLQP